MMTRLEKIIIWLTNHWRPVALLPVAAIFFIGVSAYNFYGQADGFVKWTSPDETANYQLAKQYAENDKLMFLEKYNLVADGLIQPRSLKADGIWLKPVSFLGLPLLYGALGKVLGVDMLPYLTPALAALGLLFYYGIIRRCFDEQVAWWSALLLAVFPVYIYYSAHSFFHNVPFVVLLLASLYCWLLAADDRWWSWWAAAGAGAALGWAVATRTSELLWLAPLTVWWLILYGRNLGWRKLVIAALALVTAYSPISYWNYLLYGSPWSSGYPQMDQSIKELAAASGGALKSAVDFQGLATLQDYSRRFFETLFHFGFHPRRSLDMAQHYFWQMFNWLMYASIFGFVYFAWSWRKSPRQRLAYVSGLIWLSVVLISYYGSWVFFDNPDPNARTIGNSYTRYWLPIYLCLLPLAALAIVKVSNVLVWRPAKILTASGLWLLMAYLSLRLVISGSDEGLLPGFQRLRQSRVEYQQLLKLTAADSVIIGRYHDKLIWPERRVIIGLLTDHNMNERYARLAHYLPIYYYNFSFQQKDLDYLNRGPLLRVGLKIDVIAQLSDSFTLYRLNLIN